jgi:plasmid stabilization system protein ParE
MSWAGRPEKYPPDKFRLDNEGNYRAFETHSYRISYKFTDREIRILRIRHVRQSPKPY